MRKRILSALLAVMFLFTGLPGTAWAVGEGNMEAGGGQTETVTGDSFWNGDWGIRFCVVDVASQTVVSATYDAANKSSGYENYIHFGKTNKFDYRGGASLSFQQSDYSWEDPAVTIPTIVRTSGAPDIKAIKDYFTDETVIRWIGDVTGMAYDTLISGDYKLFIEPILYYTFDSQKYAMTATEAALFDRAINGLLLRTMGNATHQQLPLSLYLEKSDLGFSKWAGAKTGIQNDTNIINYLGMGIVSFIPEEDPEPGTGGDGDGPTVPISFRKTDPERFNAANYNTGLITFAPASSNSAAFDNISGAVIEISGNGTGAGTYELPCTVELGEGTFTVREVAPPYGYLLNDAWSAEITVEVEKDRPIQRIAAEPLRQMLADCRAAGNDCYLNSAYRTHKQQIQILDLRTQEYEDKGMTHEEAYEESLKTVALPGTSEHELGLSTDLVGKEANEWLAIHCWEYGFILRYPADKEDITGITNEPWHFRYVGVEVAMDMKDTGLCLEEYLGAV